MHRYLSVALCLWAITTVIGAGEKVRTWTSVNGATLDARYMQTRGSAALLQKPDGKTVQISLGSLSAEDRAYVRNLALKQYGAEPPPPANYKVPIGTITPVITCRREPAWSYHLYLPSNFNLSRKWPVMFVMSPGGGQAGGLKRYVPGAEQNGWILAISVQSKNGFEQSDTAVSAMVDDVLEQQPIDTERLYASGFSGGARMAFATAEAYKKKDFAGILPCGAGGARASLWKGTDIYGLCGSNCFNRWDMACTKKTLSNEYYLWFFPGAHAWAGPVDIADGITWLNGRYLKKARLNKPLIGEKHRYVKGVLSTIGAIIDKDPERAYRLTTTLKHTGVQPYYKNDLTAYVQQLKAMPALRDYAQAEAAMHALADKYFATNVMDFRNNNCPPQLTAAAAALATQYKGLKIAETIERMGGKTQIP
ncbi:MAG: hypothetical protein HN919_14895 [Verrucomicrobia bacterium]|jgi:hypothetical protein|nr:hypothetical protein [Verrucomicrobiota bacterium]